MTTLRLQSAADLLCACGCGRPVTGKRISARYASAACRARASARRKVDRAGLPGIVRAVRLLKSGKVSVIVHMPPLFAQEAQLRQRGDEVRIGLP